MKIQCSTEVGQDGAQNSAQDEDIDQTREKVSQDVKHAANLDVAVKQKEADARNDHKEDLVAAAKRTKAECHSGNGVDLFAAVAVKQTDAHAAHAAAAVEQTDAHVADLAGVNLKKEDAKENARVKDAKADGVVKAPRK